MSRRRASSLPSTCLFLLPGEVRVQVPDIPSCETMSDSWRDKDNVPFLDDLCFPATDPRASLIAHSTGRLRIEYGPATFKGRRTLLDPVQVDDIPVDRRRFGGAMEEIQAEQFLPLEEPSCLIPLYLGLEISEGEQMLFPHDANPATEFSGSRPTTGSDRSKDATDGAHLSWPPSVSWLPTSCRGTPLY